MVAETSSLSPVTVFRPYSEEIQSLVSFCPAAGTQALVSIGNPTHAYILTATYLLHVQECQIAHFKICVLEER